jgi:hypothetical protein
VVKRLSEIPFKFDSRRFGPGERCEDMQAGDIVLVRHETLMGKAIRTCERIHSEWCYAWCNHAAPCVEGGTNGLLAEMRCKGEVLTPIAQLDSCYYTVTHCYVDPLLVRMALLFAQESVGKGYGFTQIPADLLNALTGFELSAGFGDRMVCSTETTRFLERFGLVPDQTPAAVQPSDLSRYFGIHRDWVLAR